MKKHIKITVLFFLILAISHAQWTLKLSSNVLIRTWKLTTKADKDEKNLNGAFIVLTQGEKVIIRTTSEPNGDFTVMVPANGEFILTVSYPGCNSKKFLINTLNVPDNLNNDTYKPSFSIGGFIMAKPFPGIDYSGLQQELVKVEYRPKLKNFYHDDDYTNNGINIVQKIAEAENKLVDEFCSTNKAGDIALAKPDCPLAKSLYEKAISLIPGEQYPVEQLVKVGLCLKDKEAAEKAKADAAAKAEADKLAAEKKAKEDADKKALIEAAAKAEADKLAAEKKAKEDADKKALAEATAKTEANKLTAEKKAKEDADKKALADAAAKAEAEKLAAEKKAKEDADKKALANAATKTEADKLAAEKKAKEDADKKIIADAIAKAAADKAAAIKAEEAKLLAASNEKAIKQKADEEKKIKEATAAKEKTEEVPVTKQENSDTPISKDKKDVIKIKQKSPKEIEAEIKAAKQREGMAKSKAEDIEAMKADAEKAKAKRLEKQKADREKEEKQKEGLAKSKAEDEAAMREAESKKEKAAADREAQKKEKKKLDYETRTKDTQGEMGKGNSEYIIPQALGSSKEKYKENIKRADDYFKMKRYDEAKTAYLEALKYNENDPYATTKLADIEKLTVPK